jgi:hypothetical protein
VALAGEVPNGQIPGMRLTRAQALRKLNAATVPAFVTVPKTEEEDMKMKAARDERGD